jgi:D-sedoheptulose 7-phosphate isomerase
MTGFLYPFLEGEPHDTDTLLADLAASAQAKAAESEALRQATLRRERARLEVVAAAMAGRFRRHGRLFTFGNGGSSTDATSVAELFANPSWGVPLPARSLVTDPAVLTALANDVGFELVFSRQLIAHASSTDIAIGISTSGNSQNVVNAFAEARRRDVLTVGLAGYDGGDFARSSDVEHCFVVASDSVHRIQEAQGALMFALWLAVQGCLAASGDNGG